MSLFNFTKPQPTPPAWSYHVCGLYYTTYSHARMRELEKMYLPQVDLQAHTSILSTTSRTVLTQTFLNPSSTKGIKEVRYTFPLYDGVSVVGFTCHVGDRIIVGEVKEKEKARAVFKEAVAQGQTAGLFEQLPDASDVFTTTIGNVPPGAKVVVKITYLGELKHDMEVDGIRFTIPTQICPRYGSQPLELASSTATQANGSGISITVDAEMAEGSFIQRIQSPSHPIAISMGTTSVAPNAEPSMTRASATLSLGEARLDSDFVIQIAAKDTGVPKAILETHPTLPNQRALMATLVPKFALPPEKPEVVFVVDRSGSMAGSRITLVVQALKVFLKSLPVGVKFNICSFGSSYSFLWEKSAPYSQATLDGAIAHVEMFSANYGGTEMLQPVKATIEKRYKDIPLEVMLLTDGEIWDQQALFSLLNTEVHQSKQPIRVFTLGVGHGVSHSLIEGVAKAGNGFSQSVGEGEKMDSKVVRMLKGALSPHVNDYTLEVKYSKTTSKEEDFEIIEKVADALTIKLNLNKEKEAAKTKKPISLFDTSADPDKVDPPADDATGEARYAHLPEIAVPKIIQAPQSIPTLFAFNRTSVYLLLGPDAPQKTPTSVVLKGTSNHGPLELEIPVQVLDTPGETIHQLAAKKAISELEAGRGWLPEARASASGELIKTKFESRFEDMVEREAVRLGVQFQVGGKWCSFVAVEKKDEKKDEDDDTMTEDFEWLDDKNTPPGTEDEDDAELESDLDRLGAAVAKQRVLSQAISEEISEQMCNLDTLTSNASTATNAKRKRVMRKQTQADPYMSQQQLGSQQPRGGGGLFSSIPSTSLFANQQQLPPPAPSAFGGAVSGASLDLSDTGMESGLHSLDNFDFDSFLNTGSATPGAMNQMLERGEKLDGSLQARSDALGAQSQTFAASAKKQGGGGLFSTAGSLFGGGLFGSSSATHAAPPPPPPPQRMAAPTHPTGGLFGAPPPPAAPAPASMTFGHQTMLLEQQNKKRLLMTRQEPEQTPSAPLQAQPVGYSASNLFGNTNSISPPVVQAAALAPPAVEVDQALLEQYQKEMANAACMPLPDEELDEELDDDMESAPSKSAPGATQTNLFGGLSTSTPMQQATGTSSGALFGNTTGSTNPFGNQSTSSLMPQATGTNSGGLFGGAGGFGSASQSSGYGQASAFGQTSSPFGAQPGRGTPQAPTKPKTDEDILDALISLQTFEGYWSWTSSLLNTVGVAEPTAEKLANDLEVDGKVLVTALVIAYLERKMSGKRDVWELVVDKARAWLEGNGVSDVDGLSAKASALL